ncbi:Fusaric acid resistance protein-like-domain-containing protein [Spinellus fusiger]|nr:Fusaric acid resistance protein-like-domain-containing protein [Spinellus fusiger]
MTNQCTISQSPSYKPSYIDQYPSFSGSLGDNHSDFEVVLDDGTLQRRTVSLSTMPGTRAPFAPDKQRTRIKYMDENTRLLLKRERTKSALQGQSSDSEEESIFHKDTFIDRFCTVCEAWMPSQESKLVLKCSFAFFLGSLFTFIPVLNYTVGGHLAATHVVATVTTFFSPAKTVGNMIEALSFGCLYTLMATGASLISMLTSVYLRDQDRILTSYIVTLGVWLAGSTFILSLIKARWNKPNIGTDIAGSLQSTSVLLKLLTKTFLLDTDLPEFTANQQLESAINSYRSSFTNLRVSLHEAKLEFSDVGLRRHVEYGEVVDSLQRLSQHIGGLRSSCGIQFEMMNKPINVWNIKPDQQRKRMENELRRELSSIITNNSNMEGPLVEFIRTIQQPMKSLAYTCKQTIVHLQAHFNGKATYSTPSFRLLRQNLIMAMSLFEESQHHALSRMFRRKMIGQTKQPDYLPGELHSHLIKQFPAEDVYLVYFFVFCLLEFAKELEILVGAVQSVFDTREFNFITAVGAWFKLEAQEKTIISDRSMESPNNHNTFNTLHTPSPRTRIRKFFVKLWSFFSWFRQHDARYAAKSTLTAVCIATLAFIPSTHDYFQSLKMEWTLITVLAAMSPTVGGTNMIAVLRVLSTMAGSLVALVTYSLFPANGPALLFLTWVLSIPCFWMSLHHRHGRFGLFSLLAYNLVLLYKFNQRNDNSIDIMELAWMRCFTVSLGVFIGLIVTTYVWPFEARKELRRGLSDFLLQLSWLYKQLVSEYSETPQAEKDEDAILFDNLLDCPPSHSLNEQEYAALTAHNQTRAIDLQNVELQLQLCLVNLQDLLIHAPNEPRLKGPFPVKTYETMLTSCQDILDRFLSIRIVVLKDVWATQVRRDFILPASKELMEMAGNVLLYFYLLASALQLKTPLPPYLPAAEKARTALMSKLQTLPQEGPATSAYHLSENDECFMVYYAYVMIMENIIGELESLGKDMKDLFGSLIPDDQWARSFGRIDVERQSGKGRVL